MSARLKQKRKRGGGRHREGEVWKGLAAGVVGGLIVGQYRER